MDAKEREEKQNIKIKLFKECFKYIKKYFTSWDYSFDDPWYKEIHKNEDKDQFSWKDKQNFPPEEKGIYLFNSKTKFVHPYHKSGIYYIGKANSGLKKRLKRKLSLDYGSHYYKKGRYIDKNKGKNLNHYYPYLNYYQEFPTTIYCKKIDKDFEDKKSDKKILAYDMVPLIEEILISAFFTKMGNRPPSNRTGPNRLIWTDSENSKELITIYDKLLSSKILD